MKYISKFLVLATVMPILIASRCYAGTSVTGGTSSWSNGGSGGSTNSADPCSIGYTTTGNYGLGGIQQPEGPGSYTISSTYDGNCTQTVTYYFNGESYMSYNTSISGVCGCAGSLDVVTNGWGNAGQSYTLASGQINVSALANVHHYAVINLVTGGVVSTMPALTNAVSFSYATFTPGVPYAITACSANNYIQGATCVESQSGTLTNLNSFEGWQNLTTNAPGAYIVAEDMANNIYSLVQFSDGSTVSGTGGVGEVYGATYQYTAPLPCTGVPTIVLKWYDPNGPQGAGDYTNTSTYDGNCEATSVYTGPKGVYQTCGPTPVNGICNCPDAIVFKNGTNQFGNAGLSYTLDSAKINVSSLATVDHYNVINLVTGGVVSTMPALTNTVSFSYSSFTPGTLYTIAACNANNLFQGALSFQAGVGSVTVLDSFESWQDVTTNAPGADVLVIGPTNDVYSLEEFSDGRILTGSGSTIVTPQVSLSLNGPNGAALYWPASATNFVLQSTTNLSNPNWVNVTNGVPLTGVLLPTALPAAYYRLAAPSQ